MLSLRAQNENNLFNKHAEVFTDVCKRKHGANECIFCDKLIPEILQAQQLLSEKIDSIPNNSLLKINAETVLEAIITIPYKTQMDIITLTTVLQRTHDLLSNPTANNRATYASLADDVYGHPSLGMKRLSVAMTGLATALYVCGLVLLCGGFGTFGASAVIGLALVMAASLLTRTAIQLEKKSNRHGLSEQMVALSTDKKPQQPMSDLGFFAPLFSSKAKTNAPTDLQQHQKSPFLERK